MSAFLTQRLRPVQTFRFIAGGAMVFELNSFNAVVPGYALQK